MAQGIKRVEIARRCDRGNKRWKYIFKNMIYGFQRETCMYGDGELSERGHLFYSGQHLLQSYTAAAAKVALTLAPISVHKSVHGRRHAGADRPLMKGFGEDVRGTQNTLLPPGKQLEENLCTI